MVTATCINPSHQRILSRAFAVERLSFELRLDTFNLFNRVNLNNPSVDLSSNNFGRATSARVARLFQAGLRIGF